MPVLKKSDPNIYRQVGPYLNLGMQLAVAVALGVGLGYLLDTKLHSQPVFLIIGLFLGAIAGFTNIYKAVYPTRQHDDRGDGDQ